MKQYAFNGLAGCVVQRRSRRTKTMVGLYHSMQSGMESDPELPWTTVCEEHNNLVCHKTLTVARSHLADPTLWCADCQDDEEKTTQYICKAPCACLATRKEGMAECACRHNEGADVCSDCGSAMHKIFLETGERVPIRKSA